MIFAWPCGGSISRGKPDSFLVASMPSLLPLAISLVAWSSTSDGPLVKRLFRLREGFGGHARCGSVLAQGESPRASRASVSAPLTESAVARRRFRRGRRNRHARARVLPKLFVVERINFLSHGFIHLDERRPRSFESFTGELARGVYSQLCSHRDFRGRMVQNIGWPFGEN